MEQKKKIEWVSVDLRNYKHYFLDILDINIGFVDRTETQLEDPHDYQFTTFLTDLQTMDEDNPEYDGHKSIEKDLQEKVAEIIKKAGYGNFEPSKIGYEVAEMIGEED